MTYDAALHEPPPSEFSDEFVRLMKNRMAVSYHKYGAIADAYPHRVSALKSLEARLQQYHETGNTEWLVDAANFAMIEFMLPSHPDATFVATDSDASPGREWHAGTSTRPNLSKIEQTRRLEP